MHAHCKDREMHLFAAGMSGPVVETAILECRYFGIDSQLIANLPELFTNMIGGGLILSPFGAVLENPF